MRNRQTQKYNSYTAIQGVCEKHAPVVKFNLEPNFNRLYNKFGMCVANISSLSARQAQSSKGITKSKNAQRGQMAKATMGVAKPIRVWAVEHENHELAERFLIRKSAILRAKDKDAANLCQNIHDATADAPTALAGVTAEKIAALQQSIDAFSAVAPKPRGKITGRKTVTQRLANEFDTADRLLVDGLDLLIDQYEDEFPEFVADYRNARVLVEPPAAKKTPEEEKKEKTDKQPAAEKKAPKESKTPEKAAEKEKGPDRLVCVFIFLSGFKISNRANDLLPLNAED